MGPNGAELGLEGLSVGPSLVLGLLGQPIPAPSPTMRRKKRSAATAAASSTGDSTDAGGDLRRVRAAALAEPRAQSPSHGIGGSRPRRDYPRAAAGPHRRAEGHVPAEAVPDYHAPPTADDVEQIVDVAVEGGVELGSASREP